MPQRFTGFVWMILGIIGVVVLAALVLMGVDSSSAAGTGPRWRRRLVAAALALLAAVGLAPKQGSAAGGDQATPPPGPNAGAERPMCYDMAPAIHPAQQGYDRIKQRLQLLKDLTAAGKLDPAVVETTLTAIEDDVQLLQDEKYFDSISDKPENIRKLLAEARETVKTARAKLPSPATQPAAIENTEQWKHLSATWAEAERIRATDAGSYPFDEKGRNKLLADIEQAGKDIAELQKSGQLSEAEAKLLAGNLEVLRYAVGSRRPVEMRMATCYEPMMLMPARESWQRLQARLPLLKDIASSARLAPAVIEKLLWVVDEDLQTLQNERSFKQIQDTPQNIRQLRDQAADYVKAIRAKHTGATTQPATAPGKG